MDMYIFKGPQFKETSNIKVEFSKFLSILINAYFFHFPLKIIYTDSSITCQCINVISTCYFIPAYDKKGKTMPYFINITLHCRGSDRF